jgi:hypothetical protein
MKSLEEERAQLQGGLHALRKVRPARAPLSLMLPLSRAGERGRRNGYVEYFENDWSGAIGGEMCSRPWG